MTTKLTLTEGISEDDIVRTLMMQTSGLVKEEVAQMLGKTNTAAGRFNLRAYVWETVNVMHSVLSTSGLKQSIGCPADEITKEVGREEAKSVVALCSVIEYAQLVGSWAGMGTGLALTGDLPAHISGVPHADAARCAKRVIADLGMMAAAGTPIVFPNASAWVIGLTDRLWAYATAVRIFISTEASLPGTFPPTLREAIGRMAGPLASLRTAYMGCLAGIPPAYDYGQPQRFALPRTEFTGDVRKYLTLPADTKRAKTGNLLALAVAQLQLEREEGLGTYTGVETNEGRWADWAAASVVSAHLAAAWSVRDEAMDEIGHTGVRHPIAGPGREATLAMDVDRLLAATAKSTGSAKAVSPTFTRLSSAADSMIDALSSSENSTDLLYALQGPGAIVDLISKSLQTLIRMLAGIRKDVEPSPPPAAPVAKGTGKAKKDPLTIPAHAAMSVDAVDVKAPTSKLVVVNLDGDAGLPARDPGAPIPKLAEPIIPGLVASTKAVQAKLAESEGGPRVAAAAATATAPSISRLDPVPIDDPTANLYTRVYF